MSHRPASGEPSSREPSLADLRAVLAGIASGLGYTEPLTSELRLAEDMRLDSVGLLSLAVEVEDHFRVCLDAADEAAIRTVGDLERVLLGKLAADGPTGGGASDGGAP